MGGATLPSALRWWLGELGVMVPARLRALIAAHPARLLISSQGGAIVARLATRKATEQLGPLDALPTARLRRLASRSFAGRLETVILCPPEEIITRDLVLPARAARDLDAVLAFEIDRLTPFTADEMLTGWKIATPATPTRGRDGMMTVTVSVVPLLSVAAEMQAIADAGLAPPSAAARGARGSIAGPVLVPHRARAAPRGRRFAVMGLQAGLVALIVAAGFWGIVSDRRLVRGAERAEVAMTDMRQRAIDLARPARNGASGASAAAQAAFGRRKATPLAIQTLDTLTKALPDHAVLERLVLEDGTVEVTGTASNATELIGRISDATGLNEPRFLAPVRSDPEEARERFSLSAVLEGTGDETR